MKNKAFSYINITPLVDVMLVLLVIFMVTTPMLVKGIKVNLPKTHSGATKIEKKDIIISIDKNGNFYVDKVKITPDALKDYLKAHRGKTVIIKSDKRVEYGVVVKLIDIVKSVGIIRVGLATQPKQ
ncbi:ExbD/TolR family protein [Hippea jasoniae]|uniref:ExbD/TolR family protein n=1 Tax=Hippea jasoniae TaxID=944479 RepID=UPI00054F991D|nr:biopolymer transporter ExbD [Hippea jasoniae]